MLLASPGCDAAQPSVQCRRWRKLSGSAAGINCGRKPFLSADFNKKKSLKTTGKSPHIEFATFMYRCFHHASPTLALQ